MAKYQKKRFDDNVSDITRVRMPKNGEMLGFVERLLGAARMYVRCEDGKVRLCRVPGGKRRYVWVRENDLVIVKPWELEGDSKGDVVFKYQRTQEAYLRNKGFLKNL
ncbi:MAG: translation initiation factor eIF-1A [Nanoarchaeota archaeon]|nr:translation initiation factor eIF-1A [Nanoarchaeota archaeon]